MSKADKKAEKAAKFAAKQAAQAATPAEKKEPTSQDDAKGKKDKDKKKGQDKFASEETKTSFVNNIPTGQRKPFKEPIAEAYHPQAVEATWDSWWEAQGLYAADNESKDEKFVIVIPPPNVTGTLHLGHALTCSIEDAICRWNRMCGKNVCWVPGTDHAGIATQVVVEKKIWREEKKTRHDLGREEFIKRVWQWKETNGNRIYSQLRRLGASVDWNHESFTMDENLSRAVQEAFLRLHADGLIYRANRLVQWSCTLRTAISTIEVETQELTGPTKIKVPGYKDPIEFGVIHSFAYKVEGSEDEIIVATTRIETMLGDVAVAVHPDDERYKKYHGKYLIHPFVKRRIALVTDPVLVDMSFGTGAVKVTPAHDANDFACGQRHNLPQINIFTNDGNINDEGGVYAGRPRFQARLDIIKDLEALGLYRGKAANPMALGICSRSKDVLEPVLRPQWYVNCKSMAAAAVDAAKKGELQFIPSVHERIWYNWLENIQDWCISRQLWWGHRIPAYHVTMTGQDSIDDENHWIVAPTQDKAMDIANQRFPESKGKLTLTQDPDVLDTWFSSGLFPFSVFGWPNVDSKDFKAFYPGNLLETGHDILFFWVARMVMMGLQLTKTLPFTKVFLHAMVRDKFGRKMSKSLGNVVDPLDVMDGISLDALNQKLLTGNLDPTETKVAIEGQKRDFPDGIAECGADALRFGLLAYTSQGRDINLDIQRVVAYRQFCNKIWQATRFAIVFHFDATFKKPDSLDTLHKAVSGTNSFADRWILSRLHATTVAADKGFNGYEFADVTQAIYGFWLYDLCDNYLEMIKPIVKDTTPENNARRYAALSTLYICIEYGLKLLHPLMPFVTEELYHYLPGKDLNLGQQPLGGKSGSGSIMIQSYPRPADTSRFGDAKVESDMKIFQEISHAARAARASFGLTKKRVDIHITCQTPELVTLIQSNARDISTLSVANEVYALSKSDKVPDGCLSEVISPQLELHIPLAGLVDVGQEIVKLENRLDKLKEMIKSQQDRIASQGFQKSSDAIKQTANEKLASDQEELTKVEAQITKFKSMLTPEQRTKYIQDKITDKQNSITKCQATLDKLKKNLPADISTAPKKTLTMIAETEAEIASLSAAIAVLQQPSCVATGCNNPGIHACSKCLNARYCSKECQTRHWKHHKPTCQSHPN